MDIQAYELESRVIDTANTLGSNITQAGFEYIQLCIQANSVTYVDQSFTGSEVATIAANAIMFSILENQQWIKT